MRKEADGVANSDGEHDEFEKDTLGYGMCVNEEDLPLQITSQFKKSSGFKLPGLSTGVIIVGALT